MKKLFSIILCFAILLTLNINVFAVDTNNTILSYVNEASYEIYIPSSVIIDEKTLEGEIVVEIRNSKLEEDTFINVSVESRNNWFLIDEENIDNSISYTLSLGEEVVSNGDSVISTEVDIIESLKLRVSEPRVGDFVDHLTFTSGIFSNVTFVFDDQEYIAEYNMTWEEWINSEYYTSNKSDDYDLVVNSSGGISKSVNGEIIADLYKERLCLTAVKQSDKILDNYEYFWE